VGGQIVHDDNVAFRERGNETVFHPFFEEGGIDRTIVDFRRHEATKAQPRDQRDRLVVAVRHCGAQPSSAPATSGFSGQIGRGAGLIDEDKSRRVEIGLSLEPFEAALQHVRTLLLGGVRALLWNGPPLLPALYVRRRLELEGWIMQTAICVLGVDIGKNLCSLVGLDASGKVVLRRSVKRETLIALAAKLPRCIVAMEACCGAHHLGRVFAARGHEVRLMSPEYVRPYVKAQKNDDRDAEGIAEAATRPTMRFVGLKGQAQLDLQTLHRLRDRLIGERTALINQLRAILLERGIVVAKRKSNLEKFVAALFEGPDDYGLSARMRTLIADMRTQWVDVDRPIRALDAEFAAFLRENGDARLLSTIPGVGPLIASALVAAIGSGETFDHGRDLSAWLGLTPRQATTGGKPKLLGISKRGNRYLRKMFIHGARAALPHVAEYGTPLGRWLKGLLARVHKNVAVVALANKLARIAWAVLRRHQEFAAKEAAV
jgi:transposase